MRTVDKKTTEKILRGVKRVLNKNNYIKGIVKDVTRSYIDSVATYYDIEKGYSGWVQRNTLDYIALARLQTEQLRFSYRPLISIVVPVYNPDHAFLKECIESVVSQAYTNWELCMVDDASTDTAIKKIIREYAKHDSRIKLKVSKENQHIAEATNKAVAMASGEYIALLDHDDILWPNALYEVVRALNDDRSIDFLYTDEDKITGNRKEHTGPFFKPDWSPDFLHSVNYITHFSVIRKEIYEQVGGERSLCNGAQDWDLFLRIARRTQKIYHIPKVLYSWRIHEQSTAMHTKTKPYVIDAQKRAIEDDLVAQGHGDAYAVQDATHSEYWRTIHPLKGEPLISIIIPAKGRCDDLKRCIKSIYKKTTYKNFEIIIVDLEKSNEEVRDWCRVVEKKYKTTTIIAQGEMPRNYVQCIDKGAKVARGDVLVMLGSGVEVVTPDWLEQLGGEAQREDIGVVGVLLLSADGEYIHHAGVGVGVGGAAVANLFSTAEYSRPMAQTQHLMVHSRRNVAAVAGGCIVVRKKVFMGMDGFDGAYDSIYGNIDFCLRLLEQGYRNIYTPYVTLKQHVLLHESEGDVAEKKRSERRFKRVWAKYIDHDPYINANLSKETPQLIIDT